MKLKYFAIAALVCVPLLVPAKAQAGHQPYCREYTKTVWIGGDLQSAHGTACLQLDGAWKIVSFNGSHHLYNDIYYDVRRNYGPHVIIHHNPVYYRYVKPRPHVRYIYRGPRYHKPKNIHRHARKQIHKYYYGHDRHHDHHHGHHHGKGKGHWKHRR